MATLTKQETFFQIRPSVQNALIDLSNQIPEHQLTDGLLKYAYFGVNEHGIKLMVTDKRVSGFHDANENVFPIQWKSQPPSYKHWEKLAESILAFQRKR